MGGILLNKIYPPVGMYSRTWITFLYFPVATPICTVILFISKIIKNLDKLKQ